MNFIILILSLSTICYGCNLNQTQKGDPGVNGSQGTPGLAGPTGNPGQDVIISSGPIGSSIANGLSSCHHDYEFQSNHWLILRHQQNGTADQGAGTTGFDLWNVDIKDFQLISEQGSVTYCTCHYESAQATLSCTVNYAGDGKQGEVANIDLLNGSTN